MCVCILMLTLTDKTFDLQTSERLYDQKPEETPVQVSSVSASDSPAADSSFTSRFEYTENLQPAETNSGGPRVLNHIAPPKSSNFFAEYGMDSGFTKMASTNSSKVQVSYEYFFPLALECFILPPPCPPSKDQCEESCNMSVYIIQ